MDKFGHIDIFVNNAGITRDGLMIRMSEDDWDLVMDINLKGAFNCIKAVARPMMKQRSGAIINMASIVGVMGNPGQANYVASKAGLIGLTKTTAKEFASRGIRCNAVAPGFIRSAMTDVLSDDVKKKYLDSIPLGEFGETENIADVVAFLASDMSKYVTGQVINVDGDEVTLEASFVDDLGADSLDVVELIMGLETEFDIEIPDEDAEKISTVGDAVEYIKSHA